MKKEKKGYLCGPKNQTRKNMESYIRFDWAAKYMLRDKANFDILEGFLTVVLGEPVTVVEILESESNADHELGKVNRVDIKARTTRNEIILVEVQQTRQVHYLERMVFGASKAVVEHVKKGEEYETVKKVYSINIVYFDLGVGDDYFYHGETVFSGVNTHDILKVNKHERDLIVMEPYNNIFPEYYILRVKAFNKRVAENPLEEWMDYFRNAHIKDGTTAPGLAAARTKLIYMMMTEKERRQYDRHFDDLFCYQDELLAAVREGRAEGIEMGLKEGHKIGLKEGRKEGRKAGRKEGREEGRKEGREEGREEGKKTAVMEIAAKMKNNGIPHTLIAELTGLSVKEIEKLN